MTFLSHSAIFFSPKFIHFYSAASPYFEAINFDANFFTPTVEIKISLNADVPLLTISSFDFWIRSFFFGELWCAEKTLMIASWGTSIAFLESELPQVYTGSIFRGGLRGNLVNNINLNDISLCFTIHNTI